MKIAYDSPGFLPDTGGIEGHVLNLARGAVERGHEVDVLAHSFDHRFPPIQHCDSITVRRFPVFRSSRNYAFAPGLWIDLMRHARDYDIVHSNPA